MTTEHTDVTIPGAEELINRQAAITAIRGIDAARGSLETCVHVANALNEAQTAVRLMPVSALSGNGEAEPVAVKPLEWDRHTDDAEWYSKDDPAHDGLGLYWVKGSNINPGEWDLLVVGHRSDSYPSPGLAKAAAQADYEQRIRSALLTLPAPTPARAIERLELLFKSAGGIHNPDANAPILARAVMDLISPLTPDAKDKRIAELEGHVAVLSDAVIPAAPDEDSDGTVTSRAAFSAWDDMRERAEAAEAQLVSLSAKESGNAEMIEVAEMDPYGEREQWGMTFALEQFAAGLGVEKWEGGDGSESVEGDVWAEFDNIAKAGGFLTAGGDTFLSMGVNAFRAALRSPAPEGMGGPITDAQGIEWFERTFGLPLGDMPGRLDVEACRLRASLNKEEGE